MSDFASMSIYGDHELVQAMPLDGNRLSQAILTPTNTEILCTLDEKTKVVEITVFQDAGTAKIMAAISDDPANAAIKRLHPGVSTYVITTTSRLLMIGLQEESPDAKVWVDILEA